MSSSTTMTLLELYQHKIDNGDLTPDKDQAHIVAQLQELEAFLMATKARGRSLIQKLTHYYNPTNLGSNIQGIYLYGGVGRGKSMLMDLFYDTIDVRRKRRVHFHAFMLDIHARLNTLKKQPSSEDALVTVAKQIADESWLLCFDEMQVTDIADAMILGRLFEQLFARNVIIVATSNRHPNDLYKDGLHRDRFLPFIDLFKQNLTIHSLNGETDYRLQQLKSLKTTYFIASSTDERRSFLNNSFAELTHHAAPSSTELIVQGRTVPVPKYHNDIAEFTFSELCDKPLGSADYIEIAREFTTVLLSDIPRLTPRNRNAAKRFATLIDELYEHNTILIATSEAQAHLLYPDGDYSFEFERTVSRLMEMQSDDYLHKQHIG